MILIRCYFYLKCLAENLCTVRASHLVEAMEGQLNLPSNNSFIDSACAFTSALLSIDNLGGCCSL